MRLPCVDESSALDPAIGRPGHNREFTGATPTNKTHLTRWRQVRERLRLLEIGSDPKRPPFLARLLVFRSQLKIKTRLYPG